MSLYTDKRLPIVSITIYSFYGTVGEVVSDALYLLWLPFPHGSNNLLGDEGPSERAHRRILFESIELFYNNNLTTVSNMEAEIFKIYISGP